MQPVASSSRTQMSWGDLAPASTVARTGGTQRAFWRRTAVVAAFVAGDCVAFTVAVLAATALLPAASRAWTESELALFAALVLLHGVIGLYGCWGPCPIERLRRRALAALSMGAGLFVMTSAWRSPVDAAAVGLATLLLFVCGHYLEGLARLLLMRSGLWGAPTVLIGSAESCSRMASTLLANPKLGLRPIGIAADPPEDRERPGGQVPILCGIAEAHQLGGGIEVAIVSASDLAASEGVDAMRLSRLPFAHVIVAEAAGGIPNLGLRTRNLGTALGLEVRFDLFRSGHLALKRAIDLAFAVPAAIAVAPLVAVLAVAVKIADPGPAFYRQRRVGRDGRALEVLKLRTMYRDAESRLSGYLQSNPEAQAEWSRFFKLRNDPRILPGIGHLLRRSSLDELPQLWHILRGEMSLVGPRPFPPYHMNSFDPAFQSVRVSVPPGLTGLWQVSSRSGGDLEVQKEQDLFYIRNWSIWLDIYVILETFPAVFTARGAQ